MISPELVIVLWIPVAAALFMLAKPSRALVLAYLIGWLALPMVAVPIRGFWDVDKVLATNVGVALGVFFFCPGRLRGFRFTFADGAILVFSLGACVTSVVNDLGLYDGVSSATHKFFYYAVPYFFGRALIRDRRELTQAAQLIVTASAIYSVLALWEWRMSPQIHRTLYGYFQHAFIQHARWGFYRPIVCFPHALALGWFLAWTTLLAWSMHRHGQLRRVLKLSPWILVAMPAVGLACSMSLGPWGLALVGGGILFMWRKRKRRLLVAIPMLFAVLWMGGRYTGIVEEAWFTEATQQIDSERAGSLQYRIEVETRLVERAQKRPVFGWGGWGRNRPEDVRVSTDGMWVIWVGVYGLFGLTMFYAWWCWPVVMARRMPRDLELDPVLQALLVAIGLQAVNFLFNNFLSPVLTLMNGAAVTALLAMRREARQRRRLARAAAAAGPVQLPPELQLNR